MHIDLRRPSRLSTYRQRRTPRGGDGGIRSRLLLLVGLLIFVLFMMAEARKPENYHWLTRLQGGGPAQADSPPGPAARPAIVRSESGTKFLDITDSLPNRSTTNQPNSPPPPPAASDSDLPRKPAEEAQKNQELSAGPLADNASQPDNLSPGSEHWASLLGTLDSEQRLTLFRLLRRPLAARRDTSGEKLDAAALDTAAAEALLGKITQQINETFASQLERGTRNQSEETQQKQTAALIQFKSNWDSRYLPALQAIGAGQALDETAQRDLAAAREEIFRQAATGLQDATEVARPSDSLGWLLAWDRLLHSPLGGTTAVTPYELMTQPKQFRGKAVSFSGTIRGIETAPANQADLGIRQYYVLWVQPKELDRTPYCVYTAELPAELQPVDGRFELTRQPLTVRGLFWKIRTYVDTSQEVATCPLILARNIVLTAPAVAPEPYRWKPPAWLIWTITLLLPVVAIGIAWRIFQTGREFMLPRSPGRTRLIHDALQELETDESIESARRQLARLERDEEQRSP